MFRCGPRCEGDDFSWVIFVNPVMWSVGVGRRWKRRLPVSLFSTSLSLSPFLQSSCIAIVTAPFFNKGICDKRAHTYITCIYEINNLEVCTLVTGFKHLLILGCLKHENHCSAVIRTPNDVSDMPNKPLSILQKPVILSQNPTTE